MLWLDRQQEASPEARRAQAMLRRAGWVLAVAAVLAGLLLMV